MLNITNNFNNINQFNQMTNAPVPTNTNIFFQNGMMNNYKTAGEIATLISETTNRPTGMIVNNTGMVDDVLEYIPDDLALRDALNGEVYQQINQYNLENNQRSLIITHSAGNNDIMKGNQALQLMDAKVSTIDVMNVASPISQSKMQRNFDQTGMDLIGRYNNWKDPVTNSKTWGVGIIGTGILAAKLSGSYIAANSGLQLMLNYTAGASAGILASSATGSLLLKYQHPYASYHNKDFEGLKTDISNWAKQNPVNAR